MRGFRRLALHAVGDRCFRRAACCLGAGLYRSSRRCGRGTGTGPHGDRGLQQLSRRSRLQDRLRQSGMRRRPATRSPSSWTSTGTPRRARPPAASSTPSSSTVRRERRAWASGTAARSRPRSIPAAGGCSSAKSPSADSVAVSAPRLGIGSSFDFVVETGWSAGDGAQPYHDHAGPFTYTLSAPPPHHPRPPRARVLRDPRRRPTRAHRSSPHRSATPGSRSSTRG